VYLSEAEKSKYGTRNTSTVGSTTGMNKDMPLILNNNHAVGVTDGFTNKDKSTHIL